MQLDIADTRGDVMNIKELAVKYELKKDDFWLHKQSGKYIISHDAVEKIGYIEGIKLISIQTLNSERDFVRFLITMGNEEKKIITVGEADKGNCQSRYYGAMAEKRGIDRAILKLINAYEYGIYSDVEADDFRKTPNKDQNTPKEPTKKQIGMLNALCSTLGVGVDITDMSRKDISEKIDELQGEVSIMKAQQKSDDYEREYSGKKK